MAAMSDYLENKIVDLVFRGVAFTGPATIHIALYTTSPSDSSGGSEVSGNNYQRAAVTSNTTNWAATNAALSTTNPSSGTSGTTSNNGVITFNTPSGSWGTVSHFALWDAASGGNMLFWGALSASKLVQSGDAVTIQASQLQIQIDN